MTNGDEGPDYGNGLVLFAPGTPAAVRRRRLTFVGVGAVVVAMLVWPVYPLFGGASPRILGLPLFFAWVILALAVIFVALVWLYRHEADTDARLPGEAE